MKQRKIIVVGSINTDLVIDADYFPKPGETLIGHGFMANRGGKGANQAVAAARLGGQVTMIGRVGQDSLGTASLSALRSEQIDVTHVFVTEGCPSGVALITTVPTGENTIIVNSGANGKVTGDDIARSEDCFAEAGLVLMQLETPVEALVKAARLGKRYGAMVVLNPAPAPKEPLPKALVDNTDLVIPNEHEAASLSGIEITDSESAFAAIAAIRQMGFGDVIITLGAAGSAACIDGLPEIIPSFKVNAVDTTAAGDTFCGALSVALLEGRPLREAIAFASRASALSVQRKGAQMSMPYRDELSEFDKRTNLIDSALCLSSTVTF